jgi:hypothetical protein
MGPGHPYAAGYDVFWEVGGVGLGEREEASWWCTPPKIESSRLDFRAQVANGGGHMQRGSARWNDFIVPVGWTWASAA